MNYNSYGGELNMLKIRPCTLKTANEFVQLYHRHHKPTVGHKFSICCYDDDRLCGVAICGRPVSRHLDNGFTLEINRLCTDGTYNACSKLYGACKRIAKEMGFKKIITYILESENGTSLKASGYICEGKAGGCMDWQKEWKRQRSSKGNENKMECNI